MRSYLEQLNPRPIRNLYPYMQSLIKGRLWLKIFIALFLGIGVGTLLGPDIGLIHDEQAKMIGNWLALPGQIFLRLIQMIVVPLVFASIITGLAASENMEQLKRLGLRAVIYFVITTTLAIVIGISLAQTIKPGKYMDPPVGYVVSENVQVLPVEIPTEVAPVSKAPEIIANILPDNPLGAMVDKEMLQVVLFAIILAWPSW